MRIPIKTKYRPFVFLSGRKVFSAGSFPTYSSAVEWVKGMARIYGLDTSGGALKAPLPASLAA